jgi:hypothetical protein
VTAAGKLAPKKRAGRPSIVENVTRQHELIQAIRENYLQSILLADFSVSTTWLSHVLGFVTVRIAENHTIRTMSVSKGRSKFKFKYAAHLDFIDFPRAYLYRSLKKIKIKFGL